MRVMTGRGSMRAFAFFVGCLGCVVLAGVADAAPVTADKMSTPRRYIVPGRTSPQPCAFTESLPALPPSCSGRTPTLAECVTATASATQCVKDTKDTFCKKVLVESYCAAPAAEEELVFPVAKPLKNTVHAWASAQTALHIPPGQNGSGKQVPFTGLQATRPGPPPANGSAVPKTAAGGTALSQVGGGLPMRVISSSKGTYNSAVFGSWVAKHDLARGSLYNIHEGLARGTTNAQLDPQVGNVFSQITLESAWTGDGSDSPANRAVSSCHEFAYQRWFDYTRFKNAAKALNRNYRAIYTLATDPGSPVNLDKPTLKQFGYGGQANLPDAWPPAAIPRNVFFTAPSFAASVPAATKSQITAQIEKYSGTRAKKYIQPPAGSSRFGMHKTLKTQLEARYHLSDDEMDERQARQDRYLELLGSREEIWPQLQCARMPVACCQAPPTNTPTQLGALLAKVQGWARINPDPTQFTQYGADVGPVDWYESWTGATQVDLAASVRSMGGLPALKGNVNVNVNGAKRKAPPGQASQGIASRSNFQRSSYPANQALGGGSCEAQAASRKASLEAAWSAVEGSLSDMVQKEFALGAGGCLADPPAGDIGNSCDWSYEKFARYVMTAQDDDVQRAVNECNEATRGDFNALKDPAKQGHIWPCELRHNFSVDQVDAQYFIDASKKTALRRTCEIERAKETVDAYLRNNKGLVEQIPVRGSQLGESAGDQWRIGDTDSFAATLEYAMGWNMSGANNTRTTDGAWCKPVGGSNLSGKGGFWFFGKEIRVLDGSSIQETREGNAIYTASAAYRDMNGSSLGQMVPLFPSVTNAAMPVPLVTLPMAFALLGEIRADFWFAVGPIPVHIFFGANALAGVALKEIGSPTNAASCANLSTPIEQVTLNFATGTQIEPWARAEAFADASVDVGVAAAGVHMDLLLLRLGLPTGASVKADTGAALAMQTGSSLSVDALSGRVSAYTRIGAGPLSETFEVTLFSWDGIHDSVLLWGTEVTAPLKLATWTVNNKVTNEQVKCINEKNNNAESAQAVPADRSRCLKNPLQSEIAPDQKVRCAPYPIESPPFCTWIETPKPYRIRGTP